jgi:hypothetical protein
MLIGLYVGVDDATKIPVIKNNTFKNVVTGVAFEIKQEGKTVEDYADLIEALTTSDNRVVYINETDDIAALPDYWAMKSLYRFWFYNNSPYGLGGSGVPKNFGGNTTGTEVDPPIASYFTDLVAAVPGDVIVRIGNVDTNFTGKAHEKYSKNAPTRRYWNYSDTTNANKWAPIP